MRKAVKLRTLTTEEETEIRRLAASRKESHRLVQRAKVIVAMIDNPKLHATHTGLQAGFGGIQSGINWVRRFNEAGIPGLEDKPKAGRPPTHDQSVRSALISLAQQKPDTLGYPFKLWTLERLQTAFKERNGVHLSDSTIWKGLKEKGSVGNARKAGSTKQRSMILNSWKKGEHHRSLHDPIAENSGDLCGRNGYHSGKNISGRRVDIGIQSSYF